MNHVFIPSTEHHLTICLGIIKQKQIKNALIIYIENIKNSENKLFFDEFSKLKEQYQFEFHALNFDGWERILLFSFLRRAIGYRKRYRQIYRILGKVHSDSVFYVFADQNPYTQFVISTYKNCAFNLAHEGFWMYVDHELKRNNIYKRIYYKILFGRHWKPIKTIGGYCKYDNLYVLYPDFIHQRYKGNKIIKIEKKNYLNEDLKSVSNELLRKTYPTFFGLSENDVIVFLPRITSTKDLKCVESDLSKVFHSKNYNRIFLKKHPRSNSKLGFSDKINGELSCIEIPEGIPAECLFVFNEIVPVKYYLPFSTLLLVAALNASKGQLFCMEYEMQSNIIKSFDSNKGLEKFIENFKTL